MEEQHMVALAKANEVRLARAGLKREVARGARTVVELLEAPPSVLETATLADVLMYQPRWGAKRAGAVLNHLNISQSRRVRDTTARQRGLLIDLLTAGRVAA